MAAERTVDAYVAALPDSQSELGEAVRRLVRAAAPEAREAFKWAQPRPRQSPGYLKPLEKFTELIDRLNAPARNRLTELW